MFFPRDFQLRHFAGLLRGPREGTRLPGISGEVAQGIGPPLQEQLQAGQGAPDWGPQQARRIRIQTWKLTDGNPAILVGFFPTELKWKLMNTCFLLAFIETNAGMYVLVVKEESFCWKHRSWQGRTGAWNAMGWNLELFACNVKLGLIIPPY